MTLAFLPTISTAQVSDHLEYLPGVMIFQEGRSHNIIMFSPPAMVYHNTLAWVLDCSFSYLFSINCEQVIHTFYELQKYLRGVLDISVDQAE